MATAQVEIYRQFLNGMHDWLEGTVDGMTNEQATWQPPGLTSPAGAQYAHHLVGEDVLINMMILGGQPLMMTDFADKTGFDKPYPFEGGWADWAREVAIDMPALRQYAAAVYASTNAFLDDSTDESLAEIRDFSAMGMGDAPVGGVISMLALDGGCHCGEISAVKGLQGLKGYPF